MSRVLVIDDDPDICAVISTLLTSRGHEVDVAHNPSEAFELVETETYALVITDLDLQTKVSGLDLLKEFKTKDPATEVLLMSGYGTLETAIEAVRAGAFDYVSKPFDVRELDAMVERALAKKRLPAELAPPARALPSGLVGRTAGMLQVYKEIANASASRFGVFATASALHIVPSIPMMRTLFVSPGLARVPISNTGTMAAKWRADQGNRFPGNRRRASTAARMRADCITPGELSTEMSL